MSKSGRLGAAASTFGTLPIEPSERLPSSTWPRRPGRASEGRRSGGRGDRSGPGSPSFAHHILLPLCRPTRSDACSPPRSRSAPLQAVSRPRPGHEIRPPRRPWRPIAYCAYRRFGASTQGPLDFRTCTMPLMTGRSLNRGLPRLSVDSALRAVRIYPSSARSDRDYP